MQNISYLKFLETNGRALSKINPGSNEVALIADDALKALDLLQFSKLVILGGDILSEKDNNFAYAYQLWGEEYQYLNWCCDKLGNEKEYDYLMRSYRLASERITEAKKIADIFKMPCYIVLVT